MNTLLNIRRSVSFLWLAGLFAFAACEQQVDPEESGGNNGHNFAADEIAEMLTLENAAKVNGAPPEAPDMQLKINVEDTIYLMKGLSRGSRLVIRHDGLYDITGFFIGVENSSFYFDVPAVDVEKQDSTDVVYINLGDTDGFDWDFSFPIAVIPHSDGIPWDKFIKIVKADEPADPKEDQGCSITVPAPADISVFEYNGAWVWDYTIGFNYAGDLFHQEAPGLKKISVYQTGGCCNEDGTSSTVADDPYCYEKHSDGTPNQKWRSIDVRHFYVWVFDILMFFDNGRFVQDNLSMQTNYRPSKSNFCSGVAGYDFDKNFFSKWGNHDFTPGADYLNIIYDVANPPVGGKTIRSGKIEYNCHILVFILDIEGQKWEVVFRRYSGGALDGGLEEIGTLTAGHD